MTRLRFLTLLASLSLAVAAWAPGGSAYAAGGQKTEILVTIRSYLPLSQTRIRARQVEPLTWDVFRTDQVLAPKGARQTQSYRLPSDTAERLEILLKDPKTYSEAHPRDPDDSCTDAETIIIDVKQSGASRRFGFSCQAMGQLGEALDLVLQAPAQTPSTTGPLQRRYPADAGTSTIRLSSEGYLQGVAAKETTALKGSDGVWRTATVTGVPGNWSRPRYSRLGQAEATALEAILESPGS